MDLQTSRMAATQVASGTNATVSSSTRNTASATRSVVTGGTAATASEAGSTVGDGEYNTANGPYATVVGGFLRIASRYGQQAQASGRFAVIADAQRSSYVLRTATTDATATQLTLDGAGAVPSTQGCFVLDANQTISFQDMLAASTSSGAVVSKWNSDGTITRGATAASTRMVGITGSHSRPSIWGLPHGRSSPRRTRRTVPWSLP